MLSDPQTRSRYDAFGPDFRQVPEGMDPQTWRRAQAGARARERAGAGAGARGRQAGRGPGFNYTAGGDIDIDELFGGLFGSRGGRGAHGWGPVPGADQATDIQLTVEDAYHGTRRAIRLAGDDGTRTVEVTIPPGVTEGQRIRVAGQGGRGSDGARSGDLYLVVRIAPHPLYRLEGRDLYVELAAGALGGRPRHVGYGANSGRGCHGHGANRNIVRAAAAPARPRPAQPARRARRHVRGSQDHGAAAADRGRAGSVRAASCRFRFRSEEAEVTCAIVRTTQLDLDHFAAATGMHPELVRRFVAMGLLEASPDRTGCLWFAPSQVASAARIQRLRAGFALNYAAIGLVTDLLDRIAALQTALRSSRPPGG